MVHLAAHNQPTTDSAAAQLVLASASPRRHELLSLAGIPFVVRPSHAEEDDVPLPPALAAALPPLSLDDYDHPTVRAWRKAHDVQQQEPALPVLAADTVVVLDTVVLNKPDDAAHARTMLRALAGRTHHVYTGLCLSAPSLAQPLLRVVQSDVTLAALDDATIVDYVATGEPLDKAGGYGIQGLGGQLVTDVRGSHTAVVGLPLPTTWELLAAVGLHPVVSPATAYARWLDQRVNTTETPLWVASQP